MATLRHGVPVFPSDAADVVSILRRIRERSARVAVIGLGRVGLPLALNNAVAGFPVVGIDRDALRVGQLSKGMNYLRYVDDALLAEAVTSGQLQATTDFAAARDAQVVVICIPSALGQDKTPDFRKVETVARALAKHLRRGQLVCLEAGTYPGVTYEVILPALSRSGLQVGVDYFFAVAPERYDPGNDAFDVANTARIVSGVTPACTAIAAAFYRQSTPNIVELSDPRVAEMTKVFENTFRAVNIAFVNEMALVCDALDISVWDVIDAATSKPFGYMRFEPGPGVGGMGIPHDPHFLAWIARRHHSVAHFLELAGEINRLMPNFVCSKVARVLNGRGRALSGSRIFIVGVAYKRDIAEMVDSPALPVIAALERAGANVAYHDPFVPSFRDDAGALHVSTPFNVETLEETDCAVVLTDHASIDWACLVKHAPSVVDTRNATRDVRADTSNVVLL